MGMVVSGGLSIALALYLFSRMGIPGGVGVIDSVIFLVAGIAGIGLLISGIESIRHRAAAHEHWRKVEAMLGGRAPAAAANRPQTAAKPDPTMGDPNLARIAAANKRHAEAEALRNELEALNRLPEEKRQQRSGRISELRGRLIALDAQAGA